MTTIPLAQNMNLLEFFLGIRGGVVTLSKAEIVSAYLHPHLFFSNVSLPEQVSIEL